MTAEPTPAEIEAFQKGLKLGLVPEGWEYDGNGVWLKSHYIPAFTENRHTYIRADDARLIDIQAMEGLAGRELRKDAPHWIEWYRHIDTQILGWNLCDEGGWVCELPGTESEHLPALVDAVRRMRG